MKVMIFTEGGADIGVGHITRCVALYEAFVEEKITPTIIVNKDEPLIDLLKSTNFIFADWQKNLGKISALLKNTNIVVVDSYLAKIDAYKRISSFAQLAVFLDDYNRLNYPDGIVINGSIYAAEIPYPKKKSTTYLLGPNYILLRQPFRHIPQKKINPKINDILVTFGGEDMRNMTPKIVKNVLINCPHIRRRIIVGKGFENIASITKLKNRNTETIYFPTAEQIKNIMLESDLAISSGGQTLHELAGVGLPTVVVAVAENQLKNIYAWQRIGFVKYAGWWEDPSLIENIGKYIEYFQDAKTRLVSSQAGKQKVKGKGAKLVINYLLEHFSR